MVPSYHLTFTSQKGTPLLVHPMLATLGHKSGYLQDGAIVPSDLLTSQKGTPLLVHPMLATLGHRFGYLQDGAIVPSDLLTSQKGTPLLVHPMLPPDVGSPRDPYTLGEI